MSGIMDILRDPPPEFAFEISAHGIAMSRTRGPAALQFMPLPPDCLRSLPEHAGSTSPRAGRWPKADLRPARR